MQHSCRGGLSGRQLLNTRPISLFRWTFFLLLLVPIFVWVVSPSPASAHAELLKSDPASGAILDTSPTQIQLFLSEGVSLDFSQVQLYDRTRAQMQLGALGRANGDPNSIAVPILQPLQPGIYTVAWRSLSSTDGHLTAGLYAFRVKGANDSASSLSEPVVPIVPAATNATIPTDTGFDNADPFRWLVRALSLALAVLLLGGAIFTVLVVEPTAAEIKEGEPDARVGPIASRRFAKIGIAASLLLLFLLLMDLALQVAAVDSIPFFNVFGRLDSALLIVQTTRYGFTWLLKVLATVVLAVLMFTIWRARKRDVSWVWEISQAAASLLFLAEALGSHGAGATESGSAGNLPIPIISYWLHLVTAGTWIGGVIYMGLALFPAFRMAGLSREERRVFLGRSIPRFTRLAVASVVVLGVTGTYNLVIHSVDLGEIMSTAYGQLLALKIAAYIALVVIGAINVRSITPLLRARSSGDEGSRVGPAASLGRNVRIEMTLGALALICAGGLTLLPPPTGTNAASAAAATPPAEVAQPPTPAPTPGPATASTQVAGYTFTLTTTPSAAGDRLVLDLEKSDPASSPLTDVAKVLFKVTPQDVNGGSASYTATTVGTPSGDKQVWQASQPFLTLDGGYLVTATVQRTQSDDLKAAFRLDLSEDSGLRASPADVVEVLVATDPIEPVSGTVALTLTVLDGAHKPVDGAKVTIEPSMPSSGRTQPSGVAKPVAAHQGVYTLPVQLNSAGSWLLTFTVERGGKPPVKTDASIDVADPNATPTP
jgi:copper transport protein